MNQPTHAWLAVEAFRTIQKCSTTDAGKQRKLEKLVALLDQHLNDVVVAAWLPDSRQSPRGNRMREARDRICRRPRGSGDYVVLGIGPGSGWPSTHESVDAGNALAPFSLFGILRRVGWPGRAQSLAGRRCSHSIEGRSSCALPGQSKHRWWSPGFLFSVRPRVPRKVAVQPPAAAGRVAVAAS